MSDLPDYRPPPKWQGQHHRTESIACAAVRSDGTVLAMPRPARHGDILNWFAAHGHSADRQESGIECGFITSEGRFVDRQEALVIAVAAGMAIDRKPWHEGAEGRTARLYSEDVW